MSETREWLSFVRDGVASTYEGAVIPDHPALPAVARWLAEHGDALSALTTARGHAGDSVASLYVKDPLNPFRDEDSRSLDVLDALVAALTEGQG